MLGVKVISGKIMWSYSEAAIDPSSYKAITFLFFNNRVQKLLFSKVTGLDYPRGHMTSFRRLYDFYTTSHRLRIDVETTLSVKGDATLQNNKLCQKYFSSIFRTAIMQKRCWRTPISYSTFCITHFKTCFSLILLTKKLIESLAFWFLGSILVLGGYLAVVQQYQILAMSNLCFTRRSVDFRRFGVFVFYHREYSKTRNPRKILFLLLFDVRFFLSIIY